MPYKDRETQLAAQKKHYQDNKSIYKEHLYARRKKNFDYICELKAKNPCSCGENHPATLDFHHKDESSKEINISEAWMHWGLTRLKKELEKCVIICTNCHRKLHWIDVKDRYFNKK